MALGALTTAFTPPSDCATAGLGYVINSPLDNTSTAMYFLTTGAQNPTCFPSSKVPESTDYYSPGLCPQGYTAACLTSTVLSRGNGFESIVTCCPTVQKFNCFSGIPSRDWGGRDFCTATVTSATINAVPTLSDSPEDGLGMLVLTSPIVNALGIQVRHQSTDSEILGFLTPTISVSPSATNVPVTLSVAPQLDDISFTGIIIGGGVALALLIRVSSILALRQKLYGMSSFPPRVTPRNWEALPDLESLVDETGDD
ncbi:uncharacterized protein JN550_002671 [Neoarthrinium moseri]|uniref:uncharacterized protein n=1 Tax=Neoarthrinium moseri TaxID=1658444 RepID=UPI001FDB5FC8|nr:uncharacterized protein JN550_002671 [Neoarthrinium moseri]KAI1874092.1 hypothetical protein JN550_002671 [Neoarthrinium moseri]